ncbi:AI-2E family transporter [Bradyrhizobium sp.]|jgi:predicted PurR-regulated permease PerM|uniref:AI-2E family transporter n=1 Tax=Bradyrhizobium sp. TaxID=376 RepID=UPI002D2570DC|nr:AI-2E family transporter [Bradyrhizobium sp.]HZR71709.1 AI-2E family transporter [Bradyrhizobium sp.]
MRTTTLEFAKRAAILVALIPLPFLVWYLRYFLLVLVGALLVAMLLQLASEPFVRWCRLSEGLALAFAGIVILLVIATGGYLFGTQLASELQDVLSRADSAAKTIADELQRSQLGRITLSHLKGGSFSVTDILENLTKVSARLLEAVIFTVASGVYIASQPALYRRGTAQLFPLSQRRLVEETIDDIGRGLRLWLLGQAIQMCLIGTFSAIAVWLIGLPSPLALGAIAGLAEFIPYLGPVIASIPAILVAMTSGFYPALWTIVAYVIIHQIEGNVIVPMVQRRLVFIPPAVLLLSIVVVTEIFGAIGIIFAAPITVIIFVAIKKLYVRASLGQDTELPGEEAG